MTYVVTGISRGLGNAIVTELLKRNEKVIGVGRSNPFGAEIQFKNCDLSDPASVAALTFEPEDELVLINNAGVLGTIGRISEQKESNLEEVMQVNVFAPMALTKKTYSVVKDSSQFTVVNISSGAAFRSIPSWAAYCASKAALNRLTENFYLEEQELGRAIKAYAVSPGVIDTGMQDQIRNAPQEEFSSVDNFIRMKEEGELYTPETAASKLLNLLEQPYTGEVACDLRSL